MHIYIMRHGDSPTPEEAGVSSDEERPLSELGRQEAAIMAYLLERLDAAPDLILSSPLIRAWQTAEIVSRHFDSAAEVTTSHELAPGGSFSGTLAQILRAGRPRNVLLTGHMPGVGRLAGFLLWNQPDMGFHFRTAGVCRIDLPDEHPAPGYGDLRWLIGPRSAERILTVPD